MNEEKKRPDPVHARARAAEVLTATGMTSHERGEQKNDVGITIIFRFGFSCSDNLELAVKTSRSGFASKLVRNKLARRVDIINYQFGSAHSVFYLTSDGVERARELTKSTSSYVVPKRTSTKNLQHDLLAQKLTIEMLNLGRIDDYLTSREMKHMSLANYKEFDVVWLIKESKIGVEVELSEKFGPFLDNFVYSCLLSVDPDSEDEGKCSSIIIYLKEQYYDRYSSAFTAGSILKIWSNNGVNDKWILEKKITIPSWAQQKIFIRVLD